MGLAPTMTAGDDSEGTRNRRPPEQDLHVSGGIRRRARRRWTVGAFYAGAALKVTPDAAETWRSCSGDGGFRVPSSHHLPFIVGANHFGLCLVHCAAALSDANLTVVDVGANVGDSAILLESYLPGRCKFICIEPNSEWTPLLDGNTIGLPVEIMRCFIGRASAGSETYSSRNSRLKNHGVRRAIASIG